MNSTSARVALIPSSYHPHFGGVEEHTRQVALQLRQDGMPVEVWTPDRGGGVHVAEVDGCTVRYLPVPMPARTVRSLLSLAVHGPGAARAWWQAYRSFRPDLLHVQCFGPNGTYAALLAALTRLPLVLSSHGETFGDDRDVFGRSALQRTALGTALRASAAVTGCSSIVVEDLRQRFGAREMTVVPNGVDLPTRPDEMTVRGARARPGAVLLAAGRLVPNKGFDLLLRALARVSTPVRLQLVGDGPQLPELQRLCDDLGIEDRVEFVGRRTSAEVRRLMSEADVVVVPSRVEAFGIVVLEAWASGTPLVATARGGPGTLVTDGVDGRLVDPEDSASFAGVLEAVLQDPDGARALARAGGQTVRSYTWRRVADDYRRLYGQILGR